MDAEPLPENVDGVIKETHSFNHEVSHSVNWGYVAVGVGLLVTAYVLFHGVESQDENQEPRGV